MNGRLCAASTERAKNNANSIAAMRHTWLLIMLPVSLTVRCLLACFTTNDSTLWFEKPAKFGT
ncbi:hypothetical protein BW686_16135 [Pseudomonas syringae]|uniref:Uncharacterized protein n=1 Tax=Pseudomonas syringae TaxID=317 RepID=A0A244EQS8_PSESX|nr:hypothetical protein BW686_16135 [Pseudomonas syringae]